MFLICETFLALDVADKKVDQTASSAATSLEARHEAFAWFLVQPVALFLC